MNDRIRIRCDNLDTAVLNETALTLNAEPRATEDGFEAPACYVNVTPHQAERLRSFFLNNDGSTESIETDSDCPLWLIQARPQSATAAETANYVAERLPKGDARKAKTAAVAAALEELSESLQDEYNDRIE
jgi:hypothetical protein